MTKPAHECWTDVGRLLTGTSRRILECVSVKARYEVAVAALAIATATMPTQNGDHDIALSMLTEWRAGVSPSDGP